MAIGERIKILRLREELSLPALANRIGVHKNTLGRYEKGDRSPDADAILAICRELNVTPNWLLLGEERQSQKSQKDTRDEKAQALPTIRVSSFEVPADGRALGALQTLLELVSACSGSTCRGRDGEFE